MGGKFRRVGCILRRTKKSSSYEVKIKCTSFPPSPPAANILATPMTTEDTVKPSVVRN